MTYVDGSADPVSPPAGVSVLREMIAALEQIDGFLAIAEDSTEHEAVRLQAARVARPCFATLRRMLTGALEDAFPATEAGAGGAGPWLTW